MHFTLGDLILKLVGDYTPSKITPVDTDVSRQLHQSFTFTRNNILDRISNSSHWQLIFDAHAEYHNRLRKLSGFEYLSELSKFVPEATAKLVCRLYTLETILLGYNTVPKLTIEYED